MHVLRVVLCGCLLLLGATAWAAEPPSSARSRAAETRVRPVLEAELAARGLDFGAAAFLRIFKQERELELWLRGSDGAFALFKTYPICTYSGALGPKLRQGDGQAPEGFYRVPAGRLNPYSSYHLSFDLGYPNAYDRAHGRTGSLLMVHGSCVSIGCYAMGDANIEQMYTLLSAAFRAGQGEVAVHAFPFRMTEANLARAQGSAWSDFWSNLREGYDAFERTRVPPTVRVAARRYVVTEQGVGE